jgi:large subunit ribosomal protein L16
MKGDIRGRDASMNSGLAFGGLKFGSMGLMATEPARLTARQLEAARRVRRHHMSRGGKTWIRIFPDIPVSAKPAEVRMGKGKGAVSFWACKVRPGTVIFEVMGVSLEVGQHALLSSGKKFPMKTVFVRRNRSKPVNTPSSDVQPTTTPVNTGSIL